MTIHGMCLYINTTIIVLRRVKIDNQVHPPKPTYNLNPSIGSSNTSP